MRLALNRLSLLSGRSISALDRILSASSTDLLHWERDPGVRIGLGWRSKVEMVNAPHVVTLANGKLRMYFYQASRGKSGWRGGIYSAHSNTGNKWHVEKGVRIPNPWGSTVRSPRVYADGNKWRMLYVLGVGKQEAHVMEAVSADGLNWEQHKQIDILGLPDKAGIEDVYRVELQEGRIRLYLSLFIGTQTQIASAIQEDSSSFKIEEGWRIATQDNMELIANNPCVFQNEQGNWSMIFRGSSQLALNSQLFLAISQDGLNWQEPKEVLSPEQNNPNEKHGVGFPFVMALGNERWKLFYSGWWGKHWKERATLKHWTDAAEIASAHKDKNTDPWR